MSHQGGKLVLQAMESPVKNISPPETYLPCYFCGKMPPHPNRLIWKGDHMIVERSVLADCLNLSAAGICQLVEEGMPEYVSGLYDLGACIQWYIENRVKSVNTSGDVVDAHKRLHEVLTQKNELETARTRAATIEADLCLRDLQQQAAIIDRALTRPDPGLADDFADRLRLTMDRVRTRIADDLDDYNRKCEV